MIIELLTFGDELLDGRRIDTNTAWLGRRFTAMGVPPRYRQSTTDRMEDIKEAFRLALSRSDVVLSTGGLGPTADDITFEALAEMAGVSLEFHGSIYQKIQERFAARGLPCPESNRRQAMLPKGSVEIPNDWGTAPGLFFPMGQKLVFCLPGVPSEMENLFDRGVLPRVEKELRGEKKRVEKIYKFFGMGESALEEVVDRIDLHQIPGVDIRIAYTASFPTIDVTLSVSEKEMGRISSGLFQADESIRKAFGDHLIAEGGDGIETAAIRELEAKNFTLSLAESMTGGMISSKLVDVAGASKVLKSALVAYSNESKLTELGVSKETLARHGAVSEACALEMAKGAKLKGDIGISTTGIAGPSGATSEKPVGLTYVAWVGPNFEIVRRYQFRLDRNRNRMLATYEALIGLVRLLKTKT